MILNNTLTKLTIYLGLLKLVILKHSDLSCVNSRLKGCTN